MVKFARPEQWIQCGGKTVSSESQTDTSYWTEWSAYNTTPVTGSNTVEVRVKPLYRYYYYLCPSCGAHEPFYGTSDCGANIPTDAGHIKWSEIPYSQSHYQGFSYTTSKYYTTALDDGQMWIFSAGNLNDTAIGTQDVGGGAVVIATGYSSRRYVEQHDTNTVNRTAYVITPKNCQHNWGNGVVTTDPTCTTAGVRTYTCALCNETRTETIPALGHNYVGGVCTHCGQPDGDVKRGDLDGDGYVTSADAVLLARYLSRLETLTEAQLTAADLDGDGVVTVADGVLISRVLAGLETLE